MKYLIACLGNIGAEYAETRHNIGFIIADALCNDLKGNLETDRYASVAKLKFKGKVLVVIKPSTYMNLSGKAVRYWLDKENIPMENLIVVTDDLALPVGEIRIRTKGGDGGHNGLLSIIEILGTTVFNRLRMGIGNGFAKGYQVDYVLGKWTKEEIPVMLKRVPTAVEAIKSFVSTGIERTMNSFNTRSRPDSPAES
jgi:peptidyl-tRNA hydrolase, PTH1 family